MNMTNNDILIRLRYALDIKDMDMVEIFKLGGIDTIKEEVQAMLKKVDDDENTEHACSFPMLEAFLNGFIIFKRGKQELKPGQSETAVYSIHSDNVNNMMLKKLKIALSLTSEDILEILEKADVTVSKGELSAVLRKEGQRNYKPCGDRYARNFLKGLAIKYRG
jgi:uncharacterized protein YehS (DUF1456 family)